MQTNYEIQTTTAATSAGHHQSTCSCSCGWRLSTAAATSQMATRVAVRARANHFQDAHPEQRGHDSGALAFAEDLPTGHRVTVSEASKVGFAWTRSIVCACDWEISVSGETPLDTAHQARAQHRRHLGDTTRSAPHRDQLVLLGMLAIAATVLIVLASIALEAASR